jgi:hypothetical protein
MSLPDGYGEPQERNLEPVARGVYYVVPKGVQGQESGDPDQGATPSLRAISHPSEPEE